MIKILISLFALISINIAYADYYPKVNFRFIKYVKTFNKYYQKYRHSSLTSNIVIQYKDIKNPKILGAYYYKDDITIINRKKWNDLSDISREILLIHELGHHILKAEHIEGYFFFGCPKSIMHPIIVSDKCYKDYKQYYLKQLFKRGR